MRKDYDYVDKATDLCLCTTDRGHEWLSRMVDEHDCGQLDRDIVSLLATVEQDYVVFESGSGLTGMVVALDTLLYENYGVVGALPYTAVIQAFTMGWLGIKKVVWD